MIQSVVQTSTATQSHSRVQQSQVQSWQGVVDEVERSRAMVECNRVRQSYVEPRQSVVESSRANQCHGRVQQEEPSRDMVDCSRVKQSRVEPWQSIESQGRPKKGHVIGQSIQVEPRVNNDRVQYRQVQPSRAMVQCCRVKQSKVYPWQSVKGEVEPSRAMVECDKVN